MTRHGQVGLLEVPGKEHHNLMAAHAEAKNLEFEKAAALRDELKKLRETMLFEGGPGSAERYL